MAGEVAAETASSELVKRLAVSPDSVVAYKASLVAGPEPSLVVEGSPQARAARVHIAGSAMARALLSGRSGDGTIATYPYKKWQGPHWTLLSLALIDYPPGDRDLAPLFDQVYGWLLARDLPGKRTPAGQSDRARFCASQEGNAVWYSVRLGHADERTEAMASRLVRWQWADGGWNCDRRPEASTSSFQETAIPLRGLWAYGRLTGDRAVMEAADRAAELLLSRRLLWRRHDGRLIQPDWGTPVDRIAYPIQFHDVLFALQVMAEGGRLDDPRCGDALRLLESKRLTDGGFPLEEPNARTSATIESRASFADWGPSGSRRSNPLVSLAALRVLAERRAAL